MFSISFLARLFAQEFSGVLDGAMVFTVLDAILEILKVIENISMVLKDTFVNLVKELLMIRLEQFSIIQA
jgi:hypothetical protein